MDNNLGETIKQAREAKGLTLDQVADATKISKAYLRAVEENAYSKIPAEVFIKGTIRAYGNFLGMDGMRLVEEYKVNAHGLSPEQAAPPQIREATNVKITPTFKKNEEPIADSNHSLTLGLVVLIVLAVAACGYYFLFVKAPAAVSQQNINTNSAVADPALKKQTPLPNASAPDKNKAAQPGISKNGMVQIEIFCKGTCWLQVLDGKKEIYEGTLGKGQKMSFQSKDKLRITYGKIRDVQIKVNGMPESPLDTDEVVIKEYSAIKK